MDLSVYWQCRKCSADWDPDGGDESEYYICDGCRRKGETCPTCGPAAHLFELYLSSALPSLIARALESEHGDLGLASGAADKPPLSALGRALCASGADVLPTALVALFNAALDRVAARPPPARDLGLTAVALERRLRKCGREGCGADEVADGGAGAGVGGGEAAAEGGEEGGQGVKGEDRAWAGWGGS
ncbi:hypothetical protein GTA08_BOTSDO12053 [Neofusicoccum parvum]|nr:hypothetical protein GTA08_BOTSDO12053 [Neofusicoccum parvum]